MVGIYKIENKINGNCYIGQSINIQSRWNKERTAAFNTNNPAYNYPLSKAIRKYGVENFSFEILEECEASELNEKERFYIAQYDSFFNGYNQTLGGDTHILAPKEQIIKVFHELETTTKKHKEIAQECNISIEMVQGINTGRYWHQDNREYPIQKTKLIGRNYPKCKLCGKELKDYRAEHCVECSHIAQQKVPRPTKEELYNFLMTNNGNFSLAGRTFGVSDNSVRKWCKKYGIPSTSTEYHILLANKQSEEQL